MKKINFGMPRSSCYFSFNALHTGYFFTLFSRLLTIFTIDLLDLLSGTIRVSNSLDPDQDRPSGAKYLQSLSAEDKIHRRQAKGNSLHAR